jgi:hypothetical protein
MLLRSKILYIFTDPLYIPTFLNSFEKNEFHKLYSSPNTIRMTNQERRGGEDLAGLPKFSNVEKIFGRETEVDSHLYSPWSR